MRTQRLGGLRLLVLTTTIALALVSVPAVPAAADHSPPPGDLAGSGALEGTELVEEQTFLGIPCFRTTRSIFGLRGVGTYHGRTAGGQEVVYRAEIQNGQLPHEHGPLQIEVENTETYYHGPGGTHGTTGSSCDAASANSPVPAEFRIFAAGHVYAIDEGTGAQVPCIGHGTFARGDMSAGLNWRAEWSLDTDCIVVGNAAGTPGSGTAAASTVHTHHGVHGPCTDVCSNNIRVDYKQYPPAVGLHVGVAGPASAPVGNPVTVVARVTRDGAPLANAPVTFAVAGPAPAEPHGGAALTGADGRASFTFTAAIEGDYTVSASATNAGENASKTHVVRFVPPPPAAVSLAGPSQAQTEEAITSTATFTDAGDPTPGVELEFTVTGPGQATPSAGTALTDAAGQASFTFSADRAGDYTVTASGEHLGDEASAVHGVHLDINTFHREAGLTLPENEYGLQAAVIDPAGRYAYFGAAGTCLPLTCPEDGTYPRLVKVDLETFQRVGAAVLTFDDGRFQSAVIDPAGRYAYFGMDASPNDRVVKIDLTTFQRVGHLSLESADGRPVSAVVDPAGRFALFGTLVTSGARKVVKIDLTTFTRTGAITLPAGAANVDSAVIAPDAEHAYFAARGEDGLPAQLFKVDLDAFSLVGALTLGGAAEHWITSAVIDPVGDFAYLAARPAGGGAPTAARVVKVDLTTFERVGAATLSDSDERDLDVAVMDPAGEFAYFGTGSSVSPALVVKIDLKSFARAHAIPLAADEADLQAAVIDPAGDFAYFGTNQGSSPTKPVPTRVVKVAVRRSPAPWLAASNDAFSTPYATPLTVPAPGVLANDADTADGDPLTAGQASDPAGGSVALNPNGSFTYTPDTGFSGTDTFTYTATDAMDYSAPATVTVNVAPPPNGVASVVADAYGYFSNVSLFGGPYGQRGPAPTATVAPSAANIPQHAHVDAADAVYGPAVIFKSGPIDVHADGATGPSGHAASSSTVQGYPDVTERPGPLLYDAIASTCSATRSGTTASTSASTAVTNGVVETSYYVTDDPNTPEVEQGGDVRTTQTVPADPPPGYVIEGTLDHIGDSFRITFNEQVANPDGSTTVNGAHMELLGPTAIGDLYIARSTCGVELGTTTEAPAAGTFTPLPPARIFDTRDATGTCTPAPCAPVQGGSPLEVQVAGRGGVPATGVSAVVMNVTVTGPSADSFLTVWPSDAPQPGASNLNYGTNQTVPNLVMVKLSATGTVKVANFAGAAQVIFDVAGFYADDTGAVGSRYHPVDPARVLDTRDGTGTCTPAPCAALEADPIELQVAGEGGVPATGASAVVLNVTVTGPSASSFLTVWPADGSQPGASNLNYTTGQTVPNLVTVKLSPTGTIKVANFAGEAHVLADVAGWYGPAGSTEGSRYHALSPARVLDTRDATGTCTPDPCAVLPGGTPLDLLLAGQGGVPATGATAVVMNTTVTQPTASSFLTLWPAGTAQPGVSNLNYTIGQTVPNLVAVRLGTGGAVSLSNFAGSAHVLADVAGWFDDGS